ncbi:unnamed protein product [Linum tenue]|uniref:SPX domain-containing protein n=1 Tax=Linum tenue TaxID=586396 RepID=A0AAV0H7B1_9ROSI|nr:unnamed protein product [Linum tenue]
MSLIVGTIFFLLVYPNALRLKVFVTFSCRRRWLPWEKAKGKANSRMARIEKIVLFLLEQQGLLAGRIAKLNEDQDALQQEPDIAKLSQLRENYRDVGRDLLKLLFFVEINAVGLRKILKKFDKRFGYRFTDYYVKTRANHPYSQLQQVFKHVGLGAVVGAISRNLHELQEHQGSFLSIYDQSVLPLEDSVVDAMKAAVDG